jgi:hypothetical protein
MNVGDIILSFQIFVEMILFVLNYKHCKLQLHIPNIKLKSWIIEAYISAKPSLHAITILNGNP